MAMAEVFCGMPPDASDVEGPAVRKNWIISRDDMLWVAMTILLRRYGYV